MNAIIEKINAVGCGFVEFALPMLIQASVLVVLLLLADLVLGKRVRAVFRYWIWMLVLVKLVLPTSLSGPFSVGYWFGDEIASVEAIRSEYEPEASLQVVESAAPGLPYIDVTDIRPVVFEQPAAPLVSETEAPAVEKIVAPPVQVKWQGVVFLLWAAIAGALTLLLAQRAVFVRGLVRQSKDAGPALCKVLDDCRKLMKVSGKPGLKISPNATSPAVCGLFRSVILVPSNLSAALGSEDLRVVLLHELAHVKRRDLWVNLAQTLLQIVYFYNPLLWLANAVIRKAREQAVDEAVLVAMGQNAGRYPETLVSVAKLAFERPTLSLRLVGVVESKSALTARIKRILNRPIPKSAKLGVFGLAAIIVVAAFILPMAQARPYTDRAARVMKLAEEQARELNHAYIGTEHILLALAEQSDGVAVNVLDKLGISREALDGEFKKLVKIGTEAVTKSSLPQTPRAKRALEHARSEAKAFDHDYIGTEHILLGLMQEKDGVAARMLANLGVSYDVARAEVLGFVKPGSGIEIERPFVAVLSNGVTVELLGVCEHPSAGRQWWRPDGSLLDQKPYGSIKGDKIFVGGDDRGYEFVVRLGGGGDVGVQWETTPESSPRMMSFPYGKDGGALADLRVLVTKFDKKVDRASVRIEAGPKSPGDGKVPDYQWAEFKNVSLRPGVRTGVQVEGGEESATGMIVDGRGRGIAGAQVGLSTGDIGVGMSGGKLEAISKHVKSRIVETDSRGVFDIGERPEGDFDLIVACDDGFAFVGSKAFAGSREIRIKPWGRIEGRLAPGRWAEGDKIWMASLPSYMMLPHRWQLTDEELCERDGSFVFDKVPAGWFEVGYLFQTGILGHSYTCRTPIEVQAGQTSNMTLGGTGRPVVGKFIPPAGYDKPFSFDEGLRSLCTTSPKHPYPDDYDRMTKEEQRRWYLEWRKSDEYQDYLDTGWRNNDWRHYTFRINKDGSFRIEDVIAGKYDFTVWFEEPMPSKGPPREIAHYRGTIEVPPIPGGRSDEPLDVGELQTSLSDLIPPEKTVAMEAGKAVPALRVLDNETREPVEGCYFTFTGWGQVEKTNSSGIYDDPKDGFAGRLAARSRLVLWHPDYDGKSMRNYTPDKDGVVTILLDKGGDASLDVKVSLTVRGEKSDHVPRVRLLDTDGKEVRRIESSSDRIYRFSGLAGGDYTIEVYHWDSYPTFYEKVQLSGGEHKEVSVDSVTDEVARIMVAGRVINKTTGKGIEGLRIHYVGAPRDNVVTDKDGAFSGMADRARFYQCLVGSVQVEINNHIDEDLAKKLAVHIDPNSLSVRRMRDEDGDGVFCNALDCRICGSAESESGVTVEPELEFPAWDEIDSRELLEEYELGPEIERVVQDAATQAKFMVDLESGKVLTPDKDLAAAYYPDQHDRWALRIHFHSPEESTRFVRWIEKSGADIVSESGRGLQLIGGASSFYASGPPTSPRWDDVTVEEVVNKSIAHRKAADGKKDISAVTSGLYDLDESQPVWHFVTTRDGTPGIVQILEITDKPKGVRFRYRLVQKKRGEGQYTDTSAGGVEVKQPTIRRVPEDYPTVAEAVMAAQDGDTLIVGKEDSTRSKYSVTLANGVTVELVGLFGGVEKDKRVWWRADGTEMPKDSFEAYSERIKPNAWDDRPEEQLLYGYVFAASPSENVELITDVSEGTKWHTGFANTQRTARAAYVYSHTIEQVKNPPNTGGIKIAAAAGDGEQFESKVYSGNVEDTHILKGGANVIVSGPREYREFDEKMVDVTVAASDIHFEVSYELKSGVVKTANRDSVMGGPSIVSFYGTHKPLHQHSFRVFDPWDQIAKFIVNYRKYELVTFENVALKPGVKTDVKVEVGKGAADDSGGDSKRWPHISFREGMSLRDALRFLGEAHKKNIVLSDKVAGQVPVTNLYDVTFEEALQAILGTHKYTIDGNLMRVYTQEEFEAINPENGLDARTKAAATPQGYVLTNAEAQQGRAFARVWPSFRGAGGGGVSAFSNAPTDWDGVSGKGVLWKSAVPLAGNSSPVVWGDRVFVSGGKDDRLEVYCFDASSGRLHWTGDIPMTKPKAGEKFEVMEDTGLAASTMATDGERVFAIFASGDLGCFDFSGRRLWTKSLGIPDNVYGHASSLAIYRNLAIVQLDQGDEDDGKSKLIAFDASSGSIVWEQKRPVANSWASPIVTRVGETDAIITCADPWVIAYAPAGGNELWRAKCLAGDIAPSPTYASGLAFVVEPYSKMVAIRADGKGDVTKTRIAWSVDEPGPDICSPVSNGKFVFFLNSDGLALCFNAADGKKLWEEDIRDDFFASPSLVGDKLYLLTEKGEMIIAESSPEYKELKRCKLGEKCHASPAFANGRIYVRGLNNLYCIGGANSASVPSKNVSGG